MARVYTQADAKRLGLPGRVSLEMVSGERGARAVSLRLVEIPVPQPGETLRGPHKHRDFEECIYVLSGEGATHADSGVYPLKAGDAILVPAGEAHMTRNTGSVPLVLLCFFPTGDVGRATENVERS
jgi:mannose-6-phosphate isomerase-like protein (cupin superfamily)